MARQPEEFFLSEEWNGEEALSPFQRNPTHIAYADESHHNAGRYRSIALVTFDAKDEINLASELHEIISATGKSEVKWARVGGERERRAALNLFGWAVRHAARKALRVDVLLWDTQDARHAVLARDDALNLEIMYYNLFKNVLSDRWPHAKLWELRPDENVSIAWDNMHRILASGDGAGRRHQYRLTVQPTGCKLPFEVVGIREQRSSEQPFVQLADIFAGLTVFSWNNYARLQDYRLQEAKHKQLKLTGPAEEISLSRRDKERFMLLLDFVSLLKDNGLKIRFGNDGGLRSFPSETINFWCYERRSQKDRAPVRAPQQARIG